MTHEALRTERLVATPMTDRDLEFLYRLWQDPRVAMSLGGLRSRARLEPLFRRMIGDWDRLGLGSWVVRLRPDGPRIGRVGLHPTSAGGRESVELGYALLPEYWGQGHATEISGPRSDSGSTGSVWPRWWPSR